MKKQEIKITDPKKTAKFKNLKPIPKNELEVIIGGPETSRGTRTELP
ncbi:hypothetical protein [uncultured Flavobacterium sp.]